MKKHFSILLLVTSLCLLYSCDDRDLPQNSLPVITVILYENSLGDFGYQDNIYSGINNIFYHSNLSDKFKLEVYSPNDIDFSEDIIGNWFDKPKSAKELLILTSSMSADPLREHPEWVSTPEAEVLILDSDDTSLDVYTRYISLYGASFFAGLLANAFDLDNAAAIVANPYDKPINEGIDGFTNGFRLAGGEISDSDIYFLAESTADGYDLPNEAFELSYNLKDKGYEFVFPICGGSNQGVFRYLRQYESERMESSPFYTCGMDVDQQEMASSIIFSVVKKYECLLEDFISDWLEGRNRETHKNILLDSEYANVVIADKYKSNISSEEYDNLKSIAIEFEKNYYSE